MLKFLVFLFTITPIVTLSQTNVKKRKPGELFIQGSVNHLKEPVYFVYIIYFGGNNEGSGSDSARVIGNKYSFRIQTGVTAQITLYAKNPRIPDNVKNKYMITAVVEPATVVISSTDSFSNATISGSQAYTEYKLLNTRAEPYYRELSSLFRGLLKSKETGDKEAIVRFQKQIDSTSKKMNNDIYYEYLKTKSLSFLQNYALYSYARSLKNNASDDDIKKVELMYSKLSRNDQDSYFGIQTKKKIDSYKIKVGMMAPEIVQRDNLGNMISLTTKKNKYVLLDFWASWCGPCRADFPRVKELYKEYNKYGLDIIGISKDTDTTAYLKTIEDDGINLWPNALINEQITKSYFVYEIPMKILIDPKGVIIGKWLGSGEENYNSIKSMIENNIKR